MSLPVDQEHAFRSKHSRSDFLTRSTARKEFALLNLNQRVANFGGPRVNEQAEAQCLGFFRFNARNRNDLRFFERRADLFFGSAETFGFAATCPSGGLVFAKVSLSQPGFMGRAGGETFLGGKTGENKNVSKNMPGYGFGVIGLFFG